MPPPSDSPSPNRVPVSNRIALGWTCLAVLPVLALYIAHFCQPGVPLGFIHADLPYYSANGREVFERGDGLFYSNPYDPSPEAPVIYSQWLIWALGVGIVKFGFDPGVQFVVVGLVATCVSAGLTFRIVEATLPSRRFLGPLFLIAMWGGGLFVLFAIKENVVAGRPLLDELTRRMPFDGYWMLNWGVAHLFPQEAVYHACVGAMWLALLRGRAWGAVAAVGALAAAHPFAGLQHLAGVGVWLGWQALQRPGRQTFGPAVAAAAILGAFLTYYLVFLPSFESHARLQSTWSLPWTISADDLLLGYALVFGAACYRLAIDRNWRDPKTAVFVISFLCTLALAKHELWIAPRQPIHFVRGYLWMPLCIIGLPAIQASLIAVVDGASPFRRMLNLTLLACLVFSDNLGWMYAHWPRSTTRTAGDVEHQFVLTAEQWEVLRFFQASVDDGCVLCVDRRLSYLLPTYSSVNVYIGHPWNTPDVLERSAKLKRWTERGGVEPWMKDLTHVVLDSQSESLPLASDWIRIYKNAEYSIYRRRPTPAASP